MKENTLVIEINSSAPSVYSFYIDPKNTPLWISSIVKEETNEWPIKVGTIYRNQNAKGEWMEYVVTTCVPNEVFELAAKNGNYHVRYTHESLSDVRSKLTYYEWVDIGELEEPFTEDILAKLKIVIEKQ